MEHSVAVLLGDWQKQQPKDTYFYINLEGIRLYLNGSVTGLIALELFYEEQIQADYRL